MQISLGLVYLSNPPLLAAIFVFVKAKLRRVVILHQQLTTQAGAKIVPALQHVTEKAPHVGGLCHRLL